MMSWLVLWENRFVGQWCATGPVFTGDLKWIRPDHTKSFGSAAQRFSAGDAEHVAANLRARGCVEARPVPADPGTAYDAWIANLVRMEREEMKP